MKKKSHLWAWLFRSSAQSKRSWNNHIFGVPKWQILILRSSKWEFLQTFSGYFYIGVLEQFPMINLKIRNVIHEHNPIYFYIFVTFSIYKLKSDNLILLKHFWRKHGFFLEIGWITVVEMHLLLVWSIFPQQKYFV